MVGQGYASMAISDGLLYTLGNSGGEDTVFCLDAADGKVVWKYTYPARLGQYPGPRATPLVDEGRVYSLSREGHLYCFDAATGEVIWMRHIQNDFALFSPEWGFAGSPVAVADLLLLNAGVSGLALRKSDGEVVWSSPSMTIGGYSTPVLFDYEGSRYTAIFSQRALVVVEVQTGKVLGSYPWITRFDVNAVDPLVIENRIFISSGYGKGSVMLELQGNKLQPLWQNRSVASQVSSHIYIDGYIYGHDSDASMSSGNLVCVDAETGESKWAERMGMLSVIAIGGRLVILDSRGVLHVAEATSEGYREIAQAKVLGRTTWTPPAFADGRIYVRNTMGDLVCIDVST
jgi:outer membrane protein assembly factor BamB